MNVYIVDWPAIHYWLRKGSEALRGIDRFNQPALVDARCRAREYKSLQLEALGILPALDSGQPIGHVLVPDHQSHGLSGGVARHQWKGALPKKSFYEIAPGVFVASPEFAFLQMCSRSSMARLAYVACVLCSGYALSQEGGVSEAVPLATTQGLQDYLLRNASREKLRGLRALSYIHGVSRSPMETRTALRLCLPRTEGGMGLPPVELNASIPAGAIVEGTADRQGRTRFDIDLFWPQEKVGLEYNGAFHEGKAHRESDRRRQNALTANGVSLIIANREDLRDGGSLERVARQLSALLGIEFPSPTPDELQARTGLQLMLSRLEW